MEVKEIVPNLNKKVMYCDSEYTLTGSTIRRNKEGDVFYQAELLDKNNNSLCIVRLEEVKTL